METNFFFCSRRQNAYFMKIIFAFNNKVHLKKQKGTGSMGRLVKPSPVMLASHMSNSLSVGYFTSDHLPIMSGKAVKMAQVLGPCYPQGRPRQNSGPWLWLGQVQGIAAIWGEN